LIRHRGRYHSDPEQHQVKIRRVSQRDYDDEAIDACVKLSDRYITDRLLPDKAIDVMDEVGARVHLKNINVPQNILDLEKKIEDIKVGKEQGGKKPEV
jgi:ATP-dependent Clp protease ATP-binding subunit ClpA